MNIRTMAALLIASAAFTACSNEDGAVIGEQPAATQTPQVYTLTLQAANATGAQHRALELDGTKLVAKWEAGDELKVINNASMPPFLDGPLTASNVSADGQTCTFSGTLTGTIAVDNHLTLLYHIPATGTQDGTLESAAAHDQAQANVTVASVDGGNITIKESEATFNTTTAVLKLTLKDGSANALNATSLKMTVDGVDIFTASPTAATYTANGDGVLYFAVPRQMEAADHIAGEKSGGNLTDELLNTWMTNLNTYDVTFTATVGSDTYTATKTGYKLAAGKYYATELTMSKPAVGKALTESTVGMIVGSDGKAYAASDKDNLPSGVTAVAMVAYKSATAGESLAIQLNSSPEKMNWAAANTYIAGLTAVTGGTWRLPSKDDWQYMFVGCAVSGDATVPDAYNQMDPIAGFKAKIAATGITWLSSTCWSSTGSSSSAWYVGVNLNDSNARATFNQGPTSLHTIAVLGCLAF